MYMYEVDLHTYTTALMACGPLSCRAKMVSCRRAWRARWRRRSSFFPGNSGENIAVKVLCSVWRLVIQLNGTRARSMSGWWWLEHDFYFSIQLGMLSSQLTNSYFSEGWFNHQPDVLNQEDKITMGISPEQFCGSLASNHWFHGEVSAATSWHGQAGTLPSGKQIYLWKITLLMGHSTINVDFP